MGPSAFRRSFYSLFYSPARSSAHWSDRREFLTCEALGPIPELSATIAALHDALRSDLAGLVDAGTAVGSIRPGVSGDDEAVLIVAGLRGIGYQWLLQPDGFDAPRALRNLTAAATERLAAR